MENKAIRLLFKVIILLIFIQINETTRCFGLNKGFIIPIEKLYLDATDPLYAQVKPGDTLYFSAGSKNSITLKNFRGKSGSPIVIINRGGEIIIDTDNVSMYRNIMQNISPPIFNVIWWPWFQGWDQGMP